MASTVNNTGQFQPVPTGAALSMIMSRSWRMFSENPSLLLPAAVAGAVFFSLYALFAGSFAAEVTRNLSEMKLASGNFAAKAIQAAVALFSKKMLAYAALIIAFRAVAGVLHGAGMSGMFGAISLRGSASFDDYIDSMISNTGRFFGAAALRLSIFGIPALIALCASLGAMLASKHGAGVFFLGMKVLVYFAPLMIIWAVAAMFLFHIWRPACIIDGLRPVESMSSAAVFARVRFGELFLLLALRSLFVLSQILFMAAAIGLPFLKALLPESGNIARVMPLVLTVCGLAVIILNVGCIYFGLVSFTLYENRSRAALATPLD